MAILPSVDTAILCDHRRPPRVSRPSAVSPPTLPSVDAPGWHPHRRVLVLEPKPHRRIQAGPLLQQRRMRIFTFCRATGLCSCRGDGHRTGHPDIGYRTVGDLDVQTPSSMPGATVTGIPLEITPAVDSPAGPPRSPPDRPTNATSFESRVLSRNRAVIRSRRETVTPGHRVHGSHRSPPSRAAPASTTVPLGIVATESGEPLGRSDEWSESHPHLNDLLRRTRTSTCCRTPTPTDTPGPPFPMAPYSYTVDLLGSGHHTRHGRDDHGQRQHDRGDHFPVDDTGHHLPS